MTHKSSVFLGNRLTSHCKHFQMVISKCLCSIKYFWNVAPLPLLVWTSGWSWIVPALKVTTSDVWGVCMCVSCSQSKNYWCVCVGGGVLRLSVTSPSDSMDCNPLGSAVHGILQAEILEGVAISSSRGSFRPGDGVTWGSCIAGRFFTTESPGKTTATTRSGNVETLSFAKEKCRHRETELLLDVCLQKNQGG